MPYVWNPTPHDRENLPKSSEHGTVTAMVHRGWPVLIRLAIVATALVLAWRLLQGTDWSEVVQRLGTARLRWLALATICLMARGFLMSWRWGLCLSLLGQGFSRAYVLAAHLAAILVNHVTPTARLLGGVMRARYFSRRYPVPFADAYGTVLLDQLSHQIVQGLLTWAALAGLTWSLGARRTSTALLLALLVLIVFLYGWRGSPENLANSSQARWVEQWVGNRARRLGPLLTGGQRILEILRRSVGEPRLQLALALLGVIVLAVSAIAQSAVFTSLGLEVGLLQVVVVVTVGIAAGLVTGTPGGIATTEAAMIAAYIALGVPEVAATAATLLFRGLHYLVVVSLGVPALMFCEMWGGRSSRSGDRPAAADGPDGDAPAHGSPADSNG